MIKALLCLIHEDERYSMKVIVTLRIVAEKFKTFKGKILGLELRKFAFFQTTGI